MTPDIRDGDARFGVNKIYGERLGLGDSEGIAGFQSCVFGYLDVKESRLIAKTATSSSAYYSFIPFLP